VLGEETAFSFSPSDHPGRQNIRASIAIRATGCRPRIRATALCVF
jgi:hypothetical protein